MAKTVVVDTSVTIKWLSKDNEGYTEQADRLLDDALAGRVTLLAPTLNKFEVGNVLLFSKKLSIKRAEEALDFYYSLPISFIDESNELAKETFKFASSLGVTYYDAAFISLAKQYNATLVTDNFKHQGKSKSIKVKTLSDY
jgi:predicted nucleic acid-binding protein